jgi:type IV secretory pathway protease TraF
MSASNRVLAATLAGAGVALAFAPRMAPGWLWNTTASAPVGLWRLQPVRTPVVGQWLALRPPPALAGALAASRVLPAGVFLLKQVAAVPPTRVCRAGEAVVIDGRVAARARPVDRWGRPLPQWLGCRALKPGELFLLNRAQGSFDSRYFGPLPRASAVAQARAVLTTGGD